MIKKVLFALAFLLLPVSGALAQSTAAPTVPGYYGAAGSTPNCTLGPCFIPYGSSIPVTGSFSGTVGGFAPSGVFATLAVTASNASVALPTNTGTVSVTNKGASTVYVNLTVGAGTATTSSQAILSGATAGFTVGSNTFINAIADTSNTSSLSIAGGTGLVSGYGGGGSGSSGSTFLSTTKTTSSSLAANLIVNAAASSLYSFEVSADSTLSAAAWWIQIYDSTTAPTDGAVTPAKCYSMPSGSTNFSAGFGPAGPAFSTGIVIGVSTTGCFTKTASTHAFISGDYH